MLPGGQSNSEPTRRSWYEEEEKGKSLSEWIEEFKKIQIRREPWLDDLWKELEEKL
jgi:hypothetical protein